MGPQISPLFDFSTIKNHKTIKKKKKSDGDISTTSGSDHSLLERAGIAAVGAGVETPGFGS